MSATATPRPDGCWKASSPWRRSTPTTSRRSSKRCPAPDALTGSVAFLLPESVLDGSDERGAARGAIRSDRQPTQIPGDRLRVCRARRDLIVRAVILELDVGVRIVAVELDRVVTWRRLDGGDSPEGL